MKFFGIIFVIINLLSPCFGLADEVNGSLTFQGDTVHLEFSGKSNWVYDVKKINKNGRYAVQLLMEPFSETLVKQIEGFKSEFVTNVSVNKKATDGRYLIEFSLSASNIEAFDYLTDQPSRLILDFYPDTSAPAIASKVEKSPVRKPATTDLLLIANNSNLENDSKNETQKESEKSKPEKSLPKVEAKAINAGLFDGGDPDYERFTVKDYEVKEDSIIASQDRYFIPFPMLMAESETWEKVKMAPTVYDIKTKDTPENKMARLLLTLFEKKRPLVFLKTAKWFHEKYPESEYKEMVEFMTADVHFSLWEEMKSTSDFDQAMLKYKNLVKKYPTNPLSERISVRLGYIELEKKDAISALRYFNDHIGNPAFKEISLSKDLAQLGTGLAFHTLNRYDDAYKAFDNIEKNSKYKELQVEAAFRKGDIFTRKGDSLKNMPEEHVLAWSNSIKEYEAAQKKFPSESVNFPNSFYNTAEAFFWQKKYTQSLDSYREFVKKFPSHKHAPFAMTRIAELMDILGADPARVIGAYLETHFRYGESPEASIGRIRLLSIRMKGMKPKESEAAIKEIGELAKKLDLPELPQFSTVVVADGLESRGEYERAANYLIKYYQANPVKADRKLLTKRIVSNINSRIVDLVTSGDFISALKAHSAYWDKWLRNSSRLDTKFYIGKAFEDAGVDLQAENYYKEVLNRSYSLKGSSIEKELMIIEKVPSEDRLSLRLASVYEKQNKMKQAYDMLKNIRHPEKMSDDEQVERVSLAVKLLESRSENESAIRYLTELLKSWKGKPGIVASPYLKLAELELKLGRTDDALESLNKIDVMMKDSAIVPEAVHLASLQMKAEILNSQNKKDQLVNVYEKILEQYESKKGLGSIRYKLGEVYFSQGNLSKASNAWKDFKGEKSQFWQNLAQEKLKDAEWADGYKKYIKRIPAMSKQE